MISTAIIASLPLTPREVDQRFAKLLAVKRILHADIQRRLRHADGAGGGLDAGALEGFHQLLEALAFFAAQQVFALHMEVVEAQLVFLHAAIAQHLDLATGHALGGERIVVCARRLLGQEHATARGGRCVSGSVRASSVITWVRAAWVIQVLLPVTR